MQAVGRLCGLLGRTKQAYYKANEDSLMRKLAQAELMGQYVREVRKQDPGIGGVKLWHMYQKAFGQVIGRDRFMEILDRQHLKLRRKMRAPRTTDSSHGLPTYPNLIKQIIPSRPNQVWVGDIAYIPIWINEYEYRFCYPSMILDSYTEEICGWSVGESLETRYPIEALRHALKRLGEGSNTDLIHHTDRGCQYASREYVSLLKGHGIRISMTESGDPKDNAQAEMINNTMKNELLKGKAFGTIEEVRKAVSAAVDFYNNRRPHMSIDMLTPVEASRKTGPIAKRRTSYREQAIQRQDDSAAIVKAAVQ